MNNSSIVTRFAPSPTGNLHIGGARTALFNWLYAKANNGTFLLRIEDTDQERSTPQATAKLLKGLQWLGLDWDGEAISQKSRANRHREIALKMLKEGHAYKCFATNQEIEAYREDAKKHKNPLPFQSPWRDVTQAHHPDAPYVIRLKTPREGQVNIEDTIQKNIAWNANTFDDFVLLRSDSTPTYMLAVVVDDHDMGVTHVIRGNDHLMNTGRQSFIYKANGWILPSFSHIPLIHDENGKKLSKRHNATSIDEYAALGYTPEAMRNYLARLGWSHGNDELFTTEQAISWFTLNNIGKSPARLDFKKLDNVSAHHIKTATDEQLIADLLYYAHEIKKPISNPDLLKKSLRICREKSKRLGDVLNKAQFAIINRPLDFDQKALENLDSESICILKELTEIIKNANWCANELEVLARDFVASRKLGLGKIGMPLKAALSGQITSPSAFGMMEILGKEESLARITDVINDR